MEFFYTQSFIIRTFFILNILIFLSNGEIINNPIKISNNPYPFLLLSGNNYIVFTSGEALVVEKETGAIISSSNYCTFSFPYIYGSNESGEFFIYSSKKLCKIQSPSTYSTLSLTSLSFSDSSKYVGYIKENEYKDYINCRCSIEKDEIIIYGKKGSNKIIFTFIVKKISEEIETSCNNLEDQIICRMFLNGMYLCVISCDDQVYIYRITYERKFSFTGNKCTLQISNRIRIPKFSSHINVEVYRTKNENIDIICSKNKNTNIINCINVKYNLQETIEFGQCKYTLSSSSNKDFDFPIGDLNNEECVIKRFNNENLFCCGGLNKIKCERLDNNYNFVNSFTLNLEGQNNNMLIVNPSTNCAAFFYMNTLTSKQSVYSYYIYIPECENKQYIIISYHSVNEDKSGNEETINDFFTRKTNTNYYIEFDNIPTEYGNLILNEEIINENNKKILINENNPNILDFISTNEKVINGHIINYKIILEETYSAECSINLTILPCYKSCYKCSKDNSSSTLEEHNCLINNCKEDYYKDPTKDTNCFKISEKKSNWYFDYTESKFGICDSSCATCEGPLNNECLTCYNPNENSNHAYLYNKECINACPDKTFKILESEGYYKCIDCYKNYKSCSSQGDQNDMKCDTCEENDIFFYNNELKNCFKEYDSKTKQFYLPENGQISSCYEYLSYYIEENTYQCALEMPDYGFFISNAITGIFSPCHSSCKTCLLNYTENNSNCILCKNENYYNLEGNCIENCPDGYYSTLVNSQKTCLKCHDNCLKCYSSPLYDNYNKLTNMNCISCKKDIDPNDSQNLIEKYIFFEKNCFPIISYTNEKIIFDDSEINQGISKRSCFGFEKSIFYGEYECKNKPQNIFYVINDDEENTGVIKYCDEACSTCYGEKNVITQDTNCIDCSNGYFKTEDSDKNCILENLIPENYYKNENNDIYYHCYTNCKTCDGSYDEINENMNCKSCIENYYFIYDSNNCQNSNFAENNSYFLSSIDNKYHKCYYLCSKCLSNGIDENNQNCETCIKNYYFEYNTKNCFNISYIEQGYFLDKYTLNNDEISQFKKCYENCKTCTNYLIDDNMNCELCKTNYYKINGTNNCYDRELLDKGYYLKDNLFYPCEDSCLTCSGKKEIVDDNIIMNNCLSCDKINKGLYLVDDLKNCEPIEYKNNGYYLEKNSDDVEIFYKCYKTCSNCIKGIEIDINNKEIHNCETCANDNYILKDNCEQCIDYNNQFKVNPNPKNCYGMEMISYGYKLIENFWTICYERCETCLGKEIYDENNDIINQNCLICKEDFHLIYNTKNCENDSILENGYYFDDNDLKYHKCDIQCKTCKKYNIENEPNCFTCNIEDNYYPAENKPETNCYNKITIGSGYFLVQVFDSNTGIMNKKWILCYSTCESCFSKGNSIENNCTTCKSRHYLIYNTTNCITNEYAIENVYYFNLTFNQFVKCDKACKNCNYGPSKTDTNCIKCNQEQGYYSIKGKSNSNCFNSQTIKEEYYLDVFEEPYKWDQCYEYCASCSFKGSSNKMNCNSCKTNIINEQNNNTIYFILLNGNCIKSCPDNLFLTNGGDCVEICPDETYGFIPNISCVDFCPTNYKLNFEKKLCELSKLDDSVTPEDFKKMINSNLSSYADSSKIINGSNFKAQILSSSDLDPIEQIKKGISGINFGNCINVLKKKYNIQNEEDLIIVEIETKEDKEKNKNLNKKVDFVNLGKNVQVSIYDKSGRILDMSYCDEEITIMKLIDDLDDDVNLDEAMELAEKGIDVFNAKDSFFNDVCHPFKSDNGVLF